LDAGEAHALCNPPSFVISVPVAQQSDGNGPF
jgi:hypothetical protein